MTLTENNIPEAKGNQKVWLKIGTLLDGNNATPTKNANVVYSGDIILFVGINGDLPPKEVLNAGQNTPDAILPDYTLLPGLTEAHAHLFLEGAELDFETRKAYLQKDPDELLELAKKRLEKLVILGVTAVRDAGDKDGVGLALSRLYKSAARPLMPYVESPGAAIHHSGRYGSFMAEPLEDFNSLKDCVIARVDRGADRIKLIPTGIINFKQGKVTKAPQMSLEEVKALVAAAKEMGKQSFAHASGDDGIENVIEGGVDSVEHGFFVRDDQLTRMRDRQTAWVPTFAPVQKQVDLKEYMGYDDQVVANLQKILDNHARSLVKAHELGVPIIAGSDAGSYAVAHGVGFLYELELMERAGLPPGAIIHAATGRSSDRFHYYEKFGKIAPGYKSRFILTRYSPLESITNLKKDKTVIFDGAVYDSKEDMDVAGL